MSVRGAKLKVVKNNDDVKEKLAYQFNVRLRHISPPVWRRILLKSDASFWDLHCAIQDCMAWKNLHMHEFMCENEESGESYHISIDDSDFRDDLNEKNELIRNHLKSEGDSCLYTYDFGDGWEHMIELDAIITPEEGQTLPLCTDGSRACPPEDCGGPWGYEELLEALADPSHSEHKSMKEWIPENFDPEHFCCSEIKFSDDRESLVNRRT